MKTNEFIKEVKELGFLVEKSETYISVLDNYGTSLLVVYNEDICSIDTVFSAFDELDENDKIKLLKIGTEYAITPPEYREEEKKYYIRFKDNMVLDRRYVNVDTISKDISFNNPTNGIIYITQFTKQEIKKYGLEKFVDNELFELIEVK